MWREPFDLSKGKLFRATVLRVSEGEHVLVLVMHHMVSDGWSLGLLVRELAELYAGNREGRESGLGDWRFSMGILRRGREGG